MRTVLQILNATADNVNFLDDDRVNVSAAVATVRHAKALSLVSTI